MIKRLEFFLGPVRFRVLMALFGVTGLISLALNAIDDDFNWVRPLQSVLTLIFVVGAMIIMLSARSSREERLRWLVIMAPAVGGVLLGVIFLPNLQLPLFGAALGWVIAGLFLFRSGAPVEYRKAVKHLRNNRYAEAVKVMDGLINVEPKNENHYRFRAELLRVWGKLSPARRDYQKMIEIAPESAVAYNGLAEVCLQAGDYRAAHNAALKAFALAPDEWVASYNLGMIEDRLGKSHDAIQHLTKSLELKVPDARHRLLIHLYLARAYSRLNDNDAVSIQFEAIKLHRSGLEEWQVILDSDQADTLRAVLADDIQTTRAIIDKDLEPADFLHKSAG